MDSFLKFLEDNCPGDDAHSGCAEPNKPLLERCGMCASIYEAHLKAGYLQNERLKKMLNEIRGRAWRDQFDVSGSKSEFGGTVLKIIEDDPAENREVSRTKLEQYLAVSIQLLLARTDGRNEDPYLDKLDELHELLTEAEEKFIREMGKDWATH